MRGGGREERGSRKRRELEERRESAGGTCLNYEQITEIVCFGFLSDRWCLRKDGSPPTHPNK
jgi:hypothetical protein